MPKFVLMVQRESPTADAADRDLVRETFDILLSLGHTEVDARRMLDNAMSKQKKFKDVDELLRVVYDRQSA